MKLLAMEFTSEFIHIFQMTVKNGRSTLEKALHLPMPQNCYTNGMIINNDRSVSELILSTLKEEKIRDKKVVVSVSGNDCLTEEFSIPFDKKQKVIDGMVENELQKRRKLNANLIYDYVVLGDDPLQQGYIKIKVVLCPKALINNYYDVLKKAGLEPFKFDLTNHSMEFLAEKSCLSTSQEISILACINQDELHFIYCGRNEEPYYRHATITKDDMIEESMFVLSASSKFNLGTDKKETLTETVIENITKLTRFHSQRHPDLNINSIYLYGDYPDITTLCDRITNGVGVPARAYNPVSSINTLTSRLTEQLTGSMNVIGTVLSLFDPRFKNYEFFEEFEESKQEKGGNLFWIPTMVSIVIAVCVIWVAQIYNIRNKNLTNNIEELQDYLINEYNIQAYDSIQDYLDEIDARYQYNDRAVAYVDYFKNNNRLGKEEYDLIDSMVTPDVKINGVTYNRGVITLGCLGKTQYSPATFTQALSLRDEFTNVTYTGFTAIGRDREEELYSFTVTMNLTQKGGN